MKQIFTSLKISLAVVASLTTSSLTFGASLAGEGSYLSCATPDQSVKLRSEFKVATPGSEEASEFIGLTVGKKATATYTESDQHRVLYFSNGETVVREFSTGGTVLTFKEVPLSRSDRGFERKILISQSRFLKQPTYLQCWTVSATKLTTALRVTKR